LAQASQSTAVDPLLRHMTGTSLESGDAPCVRDLLLEHFREPDLEVEGKLGRRSKHKFTAGVSAEQFCALEARLTTASSSSFLGVVSAGGSRPADGSLLPIVEVTLDRFYAPPPSEGEGSPPFGRCHSGGRCGFRPLVRSSFACDETGQPQGSPFEVLHKGRLADCRVATALADSLPRAALVDLRVSFSRETAVHPERVGGADGGSLVCERLKRRRSWGGSLWRVSLTRVTTTKAVAAAGAAVGGGESREHESFEAEVELRMEVVRARLEAAAHPADEALLATRELVSALRLLASWAAEVPVTRKRRRIENLRAAEPLLAAALEAPDVKAELHRCVCEGRGALHEAKRYVCEVLRARCSSTVDEGTLYRYAGQQVARARLRHQRSVPLPVPEALPSRKDHPPE